MGGYQMTQSDKLTDFKTITKAHLIKSVETKLLKSISGLDNFELTPFFDSFITLVQEALCQKKQVKINTFGTFLIHEKKPRIGRNPKTMQEHLIPNRKTIHFRPCSVFKNQVKLTTREQ